eukprot:symbB.v1.2.039336.t1/scaffold6496.1/size17590/1
MTVPTPPVCCLFKDGREWKELLVLGEVGPKQWLCLTADWVVSEMCAVAMREALRCGTPVFFGDPLQARFEDEQ